MLGMTLDLLYGVLRGVGEPLLGSLSLLSPRFHLLCKTVLKRSHLKKCRGHLVKNVLLLLFIFGVTTCFTERCRRHPSLHLWLFWIFSCFVPNNSKNKKDLYFFSSMKRKCSYAHRLVINLQNKLKPENHAQIFGKHQFLETIQLSRKFLYKQTITESVH